MRTIVFYFDSCLVLTLAAGSVEPQRDQITIEIS